jgi:YbbR domain-containing protein
MKKLFLENLGLKIAAVLLSIVLWLFVTSRGQSEMSIDVPLEFKNMPSGIEMVNHNIKTISLNIKGQEGVIKNIKPSDIRVAVDLSKARKGEGVYYIERDDVKLPRMITVTSINPMSIKVTTEETVSKTAKVQPIIIGEPGKGYFIKSIDVIPQSVLIEGVRSEVIKTGIIKTEPLDITGFNESISQDLKIDLYGRNIRPRINTVTVRVVIAGKGK